MSSYPLMVNFRQVVRAIIFCSLLAVLSAASVSVAYGQFTLTVSSLRPRAGVDPGGSATAIIDLGPDTGFGAQVSLSCAVTSNQVTTNLPQCLVSPDLATPPATPALTITTTGETVAGTYQVTITGTSGSATQSVILYLNVADLTADYTLSALPAIIPSPIPAGSSASTTVTVTPVGSYTGNVTLSCLSISPIVTAAPYCSFNPATVNVTNGVGPTSTLTISTFGAETTATNRTHPRIFYALWLAVPGLALVGVGASGGWRKKLMGMLLLIAVAGGFLLMPACNTTTTGTKALNGRVTANNTYVITLTGADENGAAPSTVTATVSLQVITSNAAH